MKIKALLVLILAQLLYAYDLKSICQSESSFCKLFETKQIEVQGNQALTKTVFGFLPWWQYQLGSQNYLRYDLLSHLAVFSFEADSTGALKDPPYGTWPWYDVITKAVNNNVKLMMTVTNFDSLAIHKIFNDVNVRKNLINNILTKNVSGAFAGVIIDFENIQIRDKKNPTKNFLDAIKNALNNINTVNELAIAVPNVNDGSWDFNLLLNSADYLFVMCYDYNGSWSYNTSPSAPLIGNGGYNVTSTFDVYFSSIVTSNPDKLILGVPYYGNYWRLNSKDPFAQVLPYDPLRSKNNWIKPSLLYNQIIPAYSQKSIQWDKTTQTPWLSWRDSIWNQIWYDNDSSLALKYDLAIKKNLKGIGIWALGYDDGRTELWNLIERKFSRTSGIEEKQIIPKEFALYQNYPNPFNPSTAISYQLPVAGYVTLKVYDLLGREIATLVDGFKPSGTYNSPFSIRQLTDNLPAGRQGSQLPSGIYMYILRVGNYVQVRKMILLK